MAKLKHYLEAAMVPAPVSRRLPVLAFAPSLGTRLDTAAFNEIIVAVPWEKLRPGSAYPITESGWPAWRAGGVPHVDALSRFLREDR